MKWTKTDIQNWYRQQKIQRSYFDEVVLKIQNLADRFEVIKYGALSENQERYPLFFLQSRNFSENKKTALVTGGVHGYETSGVHGALEFMNSLGADFETQFNIVCFPCISPWSYETINRWNPKAIDPNRSFFLGSESEECQMFLQATLNLDPFVHIDLHETTDTDNSVFRPALAERDGIEIPFSEIPDGFYLVGDSENPAPDFQRAIVEAVSKVTHIAAADENGKIIGDEVQQNGVINYPVKKLFLCAGVFKPKFVTTTEVYPDSPRVNANICVQAQVEAIRSAMEFAAKNSL